MINASPHFWSSKQVLLTGHTGFKGSWLAFWLTQMGANVTGISLAPSDGPNLFTLLNIEEMTSSNFLDIRNKTAISSIVKKVRPQIILHLAAQALVRPSYKDPLTTFDTNIMGTANILDSIRGVDSVRVVVAVTTDKVYKNLEQVAPYRETDTLGGYDPYSASKAASEMVISSFRDSYLSEQGVAIASARAGNVIGGGDWAEDRLIPDAVRAWDANTSLVIRRPGAIRPWQHVLEPLNGYLVLAEKLYADLSLAGAYNFGPNTNEATTVQAVIEMANKNYGHGDVLWGDRIEGPHETGLLSLETTKAQEILGIFPRWSLEKSIERTMRWYQKYNNDIKADFLCKEDIATFTNAKALE